MTAMTEHEAILLDALLHASKADHNFDHDNYVIDALFRVVRANAVRDAAKALGVGTLNNSEHVNWLFDRADSIDSGRL